MLFDQAHTEDLKAWLTLELTPISDADPQVLSDYVLALLNHEADGTELQTLLKESLEDFLASKTKDFVEKTFSALKSKAYLKNAPSSASTAQPPTSQTLDSSKKRRAEDEAEKSSPPRQTRRLDEASPQAHNGTHDYASGRDERSETRSRERDSRERSYVPNQPPQPQPSKDRDEAREGARGRKQWCRNYHNMGYCPRGSICKFEHSSDMLPGGHGMPTMPHFAMGGPMMAGPMHPPPHMGQPPMMFPAGPFAMQPQVWGPPNMRPPQSPAGMVPTSDANGFAPKDNGASLVSRLGGQVSASFDASISNGTDVSPEVGGASTAASESSASPAATPSAAVALSNRGGHAGRGRGRGGPPGHFQSHRKSNTTLVIENVPVESLDLIKVNEYFKKFGTITNISIDKPGSKALVSFSQSHEARVAHESPEVIFGNRFVKVYFQRLDEPAATPASSQSPTAATAATQQHQSKPVLKPGFIPGQTSNVYHARPPAASAASSAALEERKKLLEEQKTKQAQLDAQLSEQKAMLAKLGDKDLSADDKKATMTQLKKLAEDIKASTELVKNSVESLKIPAPAPAKEALDTQSWKQEREKREKEQLDRELELHSKGAVTDSTTEELRKKLESLKAEAASLGLDGTGSATAGYPSRGRGRGGVFASRGARGYSGYPRARGGTIANRSMRLDNRTTKIKVTDLPQGVDQGKVQEYLKKFGEVESISDIQDRALTVVYKARVSGEQALRAGTEIAEIGTIKMNWVQQSANTANTSVPSGSESGLNQTETHEEDFEEDRDSSWKR